MFHKFKKNIYSQNGEDGIIEEILSRLDDKLDKTCCELGAWNGIHLSNCYNLIKNKNYSALLIEADKKKYKELCKNIPDNKIIKLNKFVHFEGSNSLDSLLEENNFNINFDFLSIDVDGCDYYLFKSLTKYKPKLICIEYNSTIPNDIEFIQKKNFNIAQGCSALSLVNLAKKKDYSLIASTNSNLFFIFNEFKENIFGSGQITVTFPDGRVEHDITLNSLIDDNCAKNYIFYGYDGRVLTTKKVRLPWHKLDIKEIKILPNSLLKFPDNYNFLQKIYFKLYSYTYLLFRYPEKFKERVKKKFKKNYQQ